MTPSRKPSEYDRIPAKGVFKSCARFCMISVFSCCAFYIIFIWLLISYAILLKESFNSLISLGDWNVSSSMNFSWFINCLVLILNCLIFWIKGLIKILQIESVKQLVIIVVMAKVSVMWTLNHMSLYAITSIIVVKITLEMTPIMIWLLIEKIVIGSFQTYNQGPTQL